MLYSVIERTVQRRSDLGYHCLPQLMTLKDEVNHDGVNSWRISTNYTTCSLTASPFLKGDLSGTSLGVTHSFDFLSLPFKSH